MSVTTVPKKGYKSVPWLFGKEIEIPEEWEVSNINSVIKSIQSGVSRLLSVKDIGYAIATSGNIQNGQFDVTDRKYWYKIDTKGVDLRNYILDNEDILLNFINSLSQIGKSCMFKQQDRDWIFTTNIFRIKSKSNISQKFFFNMLSTSLIMNQINAITQPAINQASFSQGSFKTIKILLPPLSEQQQIASILSNVDNLIQNTDKLIEKTTRLKKGLMQELLTRGISHTKFKKVPWLFRKEIDIPEEWEVTNYGELTNRITYGFTNPMPETQDGVWMITATNIKKGKIVYETARKTSHDAYTNLISDKSRPKKGLILITKDGTLGEVAIVDRDDICINQSIASIEPISEKINSDYLLISLQSYSTKQFITIFSPQTTIRHIYITDIPNWKIPLPPLPEQQQIASILSNTDEKIQSYKRYKEKLQRLKTSLMQKLLTGEVRVAV